MENLDGTVIATAMPQMAESFGASPIDLNIGMTAYLLALAVFIPMSGWLADRFGARLVFASAIGLFAASSVLCGLSIGLWEFTSARILQGLGGAMMVPVGRLVVLRATAKQGLLRSIGLYHVAWARGSHIGPARWWFHYNLRFLALDLLPECPPRTFGCMPCPLAYSRLPFQPEETL
jgi:MFS family permease